ncbi:MAG: DUF2064 domain-containing protein [Bacteroidota bacterium]|nr:DUF2064 domain-containing protein [Bacteroidota bacterium]
MTYPANDTALLLFSRTAKQEAFYKNFFSEPNYRHNEKLAQRLIDRTKKLVQQTALPFFTIDEKLQRGESFGERLSNAMADIFEKGFQQVIVIGNDCPLISAALINDAVDEVRKGHLILAPTRKGGVYMLGFTKEKFEKSSFENIRWQTSAVAEQLCQYAKEHCLSTYHLPCLDDINDYADLTSSLSELSLTDPLRLYIQSLIASINILHAGTSIAALLQACLANNNLRGPPSLTMLA